MSQGGGEWVVLSDGGWKSDFRRLLRWVLLIKCDTRGITMQVVEMSKFIKNTAPGPIM